MMSGPANCKWEETKKNKLVFMMNFTVFFLSQHFFCAAGLPPSEVFNSCLESFFLACIG